MKLKEIINDIMGRSESGNDDDTETESGDADTTESDESVSEKRSHIVNTILHQFSHKRLPRKCIKYSFLTINGVSLLAGVTIVIISTWMLADSKLLSQFLGERMFVTILLFIGIFTSIVAFIGITGFLRRRKLLFILYIICHSMFLCVIFLCAIMSVIFFDKIMRNVRDEMMGTITGYNSLEWVKEAWDNTQRNLKCCGVKSYEDWYHYDMSIPKSCCSASIDECVPMTGKMAYKIGCWMSAGLLLKSHVPAIAFSALLVSVISLASIFLAYVVQRNVKGERLRTNDRA